LFLAFYVDRPNQSTTTAPQTVIPGEFVPPIGSLAGRWNVQPSKDSWVGYVIGTQLANVSTPGAVEAKTTAVDGGIVLSSDGTLTAAAFNVDLRELHSEDPKRDASLAGEGLETDTYPSATFVLTEPVKIPEMPKSGGHVNMKVKGNLTLRGVTKPIELQLQGSYLRGALPLLEIVGSAPIRLSDFEIVPPDVAGVVKVDDHGELTVHLQLAHIPDEVSTNTVKPGTTVGGSRPEANGSIPGTTPKS
jgi:polyisoprenoid-binding protein YceI